MSRMLILVAAWCSVFGVAHLAHAREAPLTAAQERMVLGELRTALDQANARAWEQAERTMAASTATSASMTVSIAGDMMETDAIRRGRSGGPGRALKVGGRLGAGASFVATLGFLVATVDSTREADDAAAALRQRQDHRAARSVARITACLVEGGAAVTGCEATQ